MANLIIVRGLPGSGKTTFAIEWVKEDQENRQRVNRDDLRCMVNGSYVVGGESEKVVTAIRDAAIASALKLDKDVVCDDTNLPQRTARDLKRIADRVGATTHVVDFTHVPLETCLERNWNRRDKSPIPEHVIRDMYTRFIKGRKLPLPLPKEEPDDEVIEPYRASEGLAGVYLCDLDGTVALHGTHRDPYDETKVHLDKPNADVVRVIKHLIDAGEKVIFFTARKSTCYEATRQWIIDNLGVKVPVLCMRPEDDSRKDRKVKLDMFNRHIRGRYNVLGVFDDRKQVCDMWREMGLTVFNVAEGDF